MVKDFFKKLFKDEPAESVVILSPPPSKTQQTNHWEVDSLGNIKARGSFHNWVPPGYIYQDEFDLVWINKERDWFHVPNGTRVKNKHLLRYINGERIKREHPHLFNNTGSPE